MIKKITDLWPNLVRRVQGDLADEEQQQLNDQESSSSEEGAIDVDEEQLLEEYRLLYWTKLMRVEDYQENEERKWPLGPDIVEECQAVANLPDAGIEGWVPVFEPTDFNTEHGPLEIEAYRLPREELRRWAERGSELREAIVERAR